MNRSMKSLRTYLSNEREGSPWTSSSGVVVVGSGKGGVGTSTLAALLALAGARDDRRVLLVDGDESVGSLHLLLGLPDPGPGLGDLREGELTPRDLLHPLSETLWFLPGGGGGEDATLATALGERRALFRRVSTLYREFDLVVLDGGSHLASVLAACAAGAERLLALTTRDRVAMAATYALLKVTLERFPPLPVEILVNLEKASSSREVFRTMSAAGQRFLGLEPAFGGSIPDDPGLRSHMEEGGTLRTLDPASPALEAARHLHARLACEQESEEDETGPALSLPFPG